jgi:homeobox protein cut-like
LSEAPDPYPLLEATIDSLLSLSDMQALTRDNTSLNSTVTRLSSQIANLEASMASKNKEIERLKHEKDEDVKKAEDVWRGVIDEKTRNWEGKEKALLDKLEHQEGVLKEIKASYEVSQRMGPRSAGGAEEDGLAKERMAEFEILSRDLERTTLRLAEVEGRNEQLRLELANAQSQEGHATTSNDNAENEEDPLIARLQGENATLLRRFENINVQAGNEKKEWERKIRGLERTIDGLKKDKDILKEKMAKWGDYEEVRRELEILKVCDLIYLLIIDDSNGQKSWKLSFKNWMLILDSQSSFQRETMKKMVMIS